MRFVVKKVMSEVLNPQQLNIFLQLNLCCWHFITVRSSDIFKVTGFNTSKIAVCLTFSELLKSFVPHFIFWCTIPDWVPVDCFSFLHDILWTLDPDVLVTTQIWQTQRFGLLLGYIQVLLEQKWLGWSDQRNRQKLEANTDRIFTTRSTLVRRLSQFSCNCCTEVLIVVACYLRPFFFFVFFFFCLPPSPPLHFLTHSLPTPALPPQRLVRCVLWAHLGRPMAF